MLCSPKLDNKLGIDIYLLCANVIDLCCFLKGIQTTFGGTDHFLLVFEIIYSLDHSQTLCQASAISLDSQTFMAFFGHPGYYTYELVSMTLNRSI